MDRIIFSGPTICTKINFLEKIGWHRALILMTDLLVDE